MKLDSLRMPATSSQCVEDIKLVNQFQAGRYVCDSCLRSLIAAVMPLCLANTTDRYICLSQ